jgi:hypothetical protein
VLVERNMHPDWLSNAFAVADDGEDAIVGDLRVER